MAVMHNVQVTPIIGLPQFNGWAQVSTNASGSVVCAFAVSGLNAGNVGRDLVEKIRELEFESAALFHHQLQKVITEITDKGCALEFAVSAITDQEALFAVYGGHILLKRQQKVGTLLKTEQGFKIIQGRSEPEDIYVLATHHAVTFLGEIQQKLLQGYDLDTIVTSVVPAMHGAADSSLCSLGFVTLSPATHEVAHSQSRTQPPEISESSPPLTEVEMPLEVLEPVESVPPSTSLVVTRPRWSAPGLTQKLKTQLQQVRVRVIDSFQKVWSLPNRLSSKEVYVNRRPSPGWLKLLVPAIIILLILAGGHWWWRRTQRLQVQAVEAATAPLQEKITQAQSQVQANPVQSRDQIAQVVQEMEALTGQFEKQPTAKKVLLEKIEAAKGVYQQVSGREELQELGIFYDFSLIETGFIANRADSNQKQGIFLDLGKKQVIRLDLASKEVKKMPGIDKDTLTDLTLGDDQAFLLGKGLSGIALTDDAQWKSLKEEGDSNRDGQLLGYFSRYLYILNPAKRNIFRYAPPESGDTYSDPIGWLKPGKTLPFDAINSWSIDGDMWLGTKDGKVLKLTSGEPAAFEIKGLSEAFTGPLSLYTRENLNELYILEPSNSRLVIIRKNGEFIRQVKSPSLASATTLIVSEELKKALLMSGSIIFEVPL